MAAGEALDLRHGAALTANQTFTSSKGLRDRGGFGLRGDHGRACGAKPDESRLELVNRNVSLFKGILDSVKGVKLADGATILVVSNPVDILTHLAAQAGIVSQERVLGLGTVLDTCRFRSLLADKLRR